MDIIVLDTSALVSDPNIYKKFDNKLVVIPVVVLSELDKLKKFSNEVGKNARVCIRNIDNISEMGQIDLGILLDNNSLLKVDVEFDSLSEEHKKFGPLDYGDTKILVAAFELEKQYASEGKTVTLISNDINLRVKARAFGMFAKSCEEANGGSELFQGYIKHSDKEIGQQLIDQDWVDPEDVPEISLNEFIVFDDGHGKTVSLGRKDADDAIIKIKNHKPWGISAKNKEQSMAMDLIMNPAIDLVTMTGQAGSGKTLIALACAVELIIEQKKYGKCIVYRPTEAVSKDIGYLPGTAEEKIAPYFQNINDNLEILVGKRKSKADVEMLLKLARISYEPLTYIRGRSISNCLIIVDEAQNLSKEDIRSLITRASSNCKVILTGDTSQIDNKALDATDNGLFYVVEKFKNSELAGHINFTTGVRSRLAEAAVKLL